MAKGHDELVVNKTYVKYKESNYFNFFSFSIYACHFRENVPKGKVVSVCVSFLSPNKICDGNFLNFSLSTKGKVKGFPLARHSLLFELSNTVRLSSKT